MNRLCNGALAFGSGRSLEVRSNLRHTFEALRGDFGGASARAGSAVWQMRETPFSIGKTGRPLRPEDCWYLPADGQLLQHACELHNRFIKLGPRCGMRRFRQQNTENRMENQNDAPRNIARSLSTSPYTGEVRFGPRKNPRKGKRVGPKRPFSSGHVWETRQYLKLTGRTRDLALFNLGIDSKLRACDLLEIRVSDVGSVGTVFQQATIVQKKTEAPVTFEITDTTRASVLAWIEEAKLSPEDFLWRSRNSKSRRLSMSQYSRIIKQFAKVVGADPATFATHSIRRTKVTLIYRKTQNLRACQLLLGHKKIENTVRYLGLELDDALKISRDIDI